MKLDYDCARDILLKAEELCGYTDFLNPYQVSLQRFAKELPDYDIKQIYYTIMKLKEAGFIVAYKKNAAIRGSAPFLIVEEITYNGHQYLDSVRDNGIWSDVKKKASKVACVSIPVIQKIAEAVVMKKLNL